MNNIVRFGLQLLIMSVVVFGLHYGCQYLFNLSVYWNKAYYTMPQLYVVQLLLSLIVIVGVVMVKKGAASNLGYAFLGLITVKTVASYFFIQPVLNTQPQDGFLKHNFLAVFLVYLTFDVYVTYRLLNQKDTDNPSSSKKVS